MILLLLQVKPYIPVPFVCSTSYLTPLLANLPIMINGERSLIDSLRTPKTAYGRHVRYTLHEFHPLLDSSSISSAGWAQIADCVHANYALYDGFVILHGTDSLAYTASALSFIMSDLGKPVVLTGSQASIFALQSDAVDNLLGSLIIAGTFVIPEVSLFFHHRLYRGNRTTKVSAASFDAFDSPNCEPLAIVNGLGVNVNWGLVLRPTRIANFSIMTTDLDTAHVACLRIFPGIRPEMVSGVLHLPDLRGLILETFGMGNAPGGVDGGLTRAIADAVAERGIIVVNVSQCTSGFVSPVYGPGSDLGRAGVIFGLDLTAEAALTKLSYLLAHHSPTLTPDDVRERMSSSLRGEITELAQPSFRHPKGTLDAAASRLSAADAAFAALGYAIRAGDIGAVKEILDGDEVGHHLLTRCDYAGNTAVHLSSVGPNPEIMRELLLRGGSVHVRNAADNTPLFLADKVGNTRNVLLLREAGAHIWQDASIEREPKFMESASAS